MTDESIKLIFEIMALGILINEETEYCIFLRFSGHVNQLEIDIRKSKERYNDEVATSNVNTKYLEYYNKDKNDELNYLKAKRDVLKEILETHEIPFSEMEKHVETIINYEF